jgi:DNA polymerase-3 subunit gamma/tau
MLGSVDRQHVVRILEAVVDGDGAGLVHAVDGLRKLGLSAQGTLDELAAALQHMALIQSVPGMSEGDEEMATWQSLADRYAPDETQLFYSLALHGRQELPLAPDEYAGLLMLLLRWLAFKPGASSPKAEGPAAHVASGLSRQDGASGRSRQASAVTQVAQGIQPAAPLAARPVSAEFTVPVQAVAAVIPVASPVPVMAALPPAAAPVAPRPSASPDPRPEPPPWDEDAASGAMPADVTSFEDIGEWPARTQAMPGARVVERQVPEPSSIPEQERTRDPHPMAPARISGITATVVPVVPTTALGDRWADVVARLQQEGLITALVRELAMQGECVDVQDEPDLTVWRLRVERESLRGEAQRDRLAAALQKALGGEVRIELEAGVARDTPALRDQAARAGRQSAAEALIKQDPLVNSLLEQYPGARVVAGSISPL